jgi:hypothetical protein
VKLKTDTDLADILGITVEDVHRATRTKGWPCVRPKRTVWRFTDQQVEQIVAMQSRAGKKQAPPKSTGTGQSKRSASRAP